MNKKTFGTIVLLVVIVFTSCNKKNPAEPGVESGKEYFVSQQGDQANPGTREKPWDSIGYGISQLRAGDILTILQGRYEVTNLIRVMKKGSAKKWITIRGEAGASVLVDGMKANIDNASKYPYNNGIFQVENASYIRIQNIKVKNSHRTGFNIQDSHHIDILNCTSENSFSPGISAWQGCTDIRILGNTVINANDETMSWTPFTGNEAPHEAISMAGPHHFEVAWNHVLNCQKEGIDVKETAAHGTVHHNYVRDCRRQGLYIDGWFGVLEDIEMDHNVVHGCEAGIAISSENGPNTKDLSIHHNLVYDNRATGIFFSRWGEDNPRENVQVYNNTFYRNGWGPNMSGRNDYWLMGGCYLYTVNLQNVIFENNIFARNKPFEMGYTEDYGSSRMTLQNIVIRHNLIQDINTNVQYPFHMSIWADDWVHVTTGDPVIETDPQFENPDAGDFRLKSDSPAIDAGNPDAKFYDADGSRNDIGVFPAGTSTSDFWWRNDFPPIIDVE